ncbi:MAG: hypothetical protein ABIP05_18350, partial [Nitrospiraceae bacterium]
MLTKLKENLILILWMLTLSLSIYVGVFLPNAMAKAGSGSEEETSRDMVLRNDRTCTGCHDEDSDYPVL